MSKTFASSGGGAFSSLKVQPMQPAKNQILHSKPPAFS